MCLSLCRPLLEIPVEDWPCLDEGVLPQTRSRKVCIPVLTGQLHQGLIAHGGLDQ